ncbi:nucleoside 2-deoxyribosyltransferase [Tissierella carlieri]|uniref:Nucleoside 2-deoxyribosyltransferase n=1 Tax=Tissierella carlieri TaxID=689904 RepID=A0ABT1SHV9_9FIRM|nr:nucleoside 2-deoxyribosyltransferase [Tissierella carlieri]MBU5313039.1 nucleoside 2-deoxyribosyltransferase [Tissierella carlieri]MCQ4925532.1 nucleoside 2-deoxyribosyltransferase [Tissierella carlieri]
MKAYLANGLFGMGDRLLNSLIASEIRKEIKGIDLYVPQENDAINDKSSYADSITIAKADMDKLRESEFLIAVIDGVEIDSGVAAEIGAFYMMDKPIFALYTDVRQQGRDNNKKIEALINDSTENQFIYRNLFVIGLIKQREGNIYSTVEELVEGIKEYLRK